LGLKQQALPLNLEALLSHIAEALKHLEAFHLKQGEHLAHSPYNQRDTYLHKGA
jgi:hypothetical protein